MAQWSKEKANPNDINAGMEYATGDDINIQGLNSIINNSFYASELVESLSSRIQELEEQNEIYEIQIQYLYSLHGLSAED